MEYYKRKKLNRIDSVRYSKRKNIFFLCMDLLSDSALPNEKSKQTSRVRVTILIPRVITPQTSRPVRAEISVALI